jgi:hypothetical protein
MKTKKENSKKECWNRQRDMISKITSILVSDSDLTTARLNISTEINRFVSLVFDHDVPQRTKELNDALKMLARIQQSFPMKIYDVVYRNEYGFDVDVDRRKVSPGRLQVQKDK